MPMCSSRVLFGLDSSTCAWSRNQCPRADVFESIPDGGCKYEKYVRYISTDEQYFSFFNVESICEFTSTFVAICYDTS